MPPDDTIAPAASMIVLQGSGATAKVLMGQRAAGAVFMPSKFVFPGGRVDDIDHAADVPNLMSPACHAALSQHPIGAPVPPHALIAAALREMTEETGLQLAGSHLATSRSAAANFATPHAATLRFVFRAITPPGRARRFDARFFLARAQDFTGDATGFSAASGELAHLQWLSLPEARALDLPFITRVILAEVESSFGQDPFAGVGGVPFFDNYGPQPAFLRL